MSKTTKVLKPSFEDFKDKELIDKYKDIKEVTEGRADIMEELGRRAEKLIEKKKQQKEIGRTRI